MTKDSNNGLKPVGYVGPKVRMYQFAKAKTPPRYNILATSPDEIAQVVGTIVKVESPIHLDELIDRVVSFWNTKAGKRIVEYVKEGLILAVRKKWVERNGDFFFASKASIPVRSRSSLKAIPEHISPEEYREAVLLILKSGYAFPRNVLISEVRAILGFGRTTATLDMLIGRAIDDLLTDKVAGDASNGIALRS